MRSYEQRLIAVLHLDVATEEFDIPDTRIAAYAVLAMLTGACTWYKPEGRLSRADIVSLHTEMVLRALSR